MGSSLQGGFCYTASEDPDMEPQWWQGTTWVNKLRGRPKVKDLNLWQEKKVFLKEIYIDRWAEESLKVKPVESETLETFQKEVRAKALWIIGEKKPSSMMDYFCR